MLDAEGLDALLVTSRPNIRYLTGFSGSAGVVVATPGTLMLVTDFRYDEQARQESAAVARVEIEGTSVWDRLFKELGAGASELDRFRGACLKREGRRAVFDGTRSGVALETRRRAGRAAAGAERCGRGCGHSGRGGAGRDGAARHARRGA